MLSPKKIQEYYFAYYLPYENMSGVVNSWEECEKYVKGKQKAKYKKFTTHLLALQYLITLLDPVEEKALSLDNKTNTLDNIDPQALFFDAGTGRGLGVEVSVKNYNGESQLHLIQSESFFKFPLSEWGSYILPKEDNYTNNYGELLGLFFALQIAQKQEIRVIYGDSKLILDFWSQGKMNKKNLKPETIELIIIVTKQRKEFESKGGLVLYISGKNNPADMGFHKG